jgi:hypothetical protein
LTIEERNREAPLRHCEEERSDDVAIQRERKRAKQKALNLNADFAFLCAPAARDWIASP